MSRTAVFVAAGIVAVVVSAGAQTPAATTAEQRQLRYQIGVMEGVLEGAVEHGAAVTRDRLRTVVPAEMLLSESARVRGFRLDGYGVFFDVEVPMLEGSIPWIFRTLDQNDLGLDSALKALRSHIDAAGDVNLQQALKRIELQVAPMTVSNPPPGAPTLADTGIRAVTGSAAMTADDTRGAGPGDQILEDPEAAYRAAVSEALMDAMLMYSRGLGLAAGEWLTVAARRNDGRTPLAPVDTDARTIVIRVRGADLTAFLAGQISREEARQRMDVKVF